jgi:hypothetical protein
VHKKLTVDDLALKIKVCGGFLSLCSFIYDDGRQNLPIAYCTRSHTAARINRGCERAAKIRFRRPDFFFLSSARR